ncbi:DsrE family protein [Gemmatimonadota bacterium]
MQTRQKVLAGILITMIVVAVTGSTLLVVTLTERAHAESESAVTVEQDSETTKLAVVWTSGDRDVALGMVFMYTFNAKRAGWFDEVQLIVWGPSEKLLATDEELQEYVDRMKQAGVEIIACRACAEMYGVSSDLEECGVDVKYAGVPLSDVLKSDWKVITF